MADYAQKEDEKYSKLYKSGEYGPEIPTRLHRLQKWIKQATTIEGKDIVDLGCGKAALMKLLSGYKSYMGVDISEFVIHRNKANYQRSSNNNRFLHCNLERLPFDNNEYDIAFCCDVMEHVPPDRVDRILKEAVRVAPTVIFTISCVDCPYSEKAGEPLHLTIRSPKWWREKLSKLTEIKEEQIHGGQVTFYTGVGYNPRRVVMPPKLKVRLRQTKDGGTWITRHNRAAEAWLDETMDRFGNQLLWYPKIETPHNIINMTRQYEGKVCTIVGKGPSLDYLRDFHFEGSENPIIALNESIHKVEIEAPIPCRENLYVLRQDVGIDTEPKYAKLLHHNAVRHLYPEIKDRWIFNDQSFGYKSRQLSVIIAIHVARLWGCTQINLISFDASVNGDTNYAKVIGMSPGRTASGLQDRFLKHRRRIITTAGHLPIKWITPEEKL